MFGLGPQELLLILLIVLILFGAKRIPDIAAGLGRGIRDFKRALNETGDTAAKSNEAEKGAAPSNTTEKKE